MAQKTCIELTCGPGPAYRLCATGLWAFALVVLLWLTGRIPTLLTVAGSLILLYEAPWWRLPPRCSGRIRLYRDGGCESADGAGAWLARAWSTRWLTVLTVKTTRGRARRIIAAWRNAPDDYRLLRTWLSLPVVSAAPRGRGFSEAGP